MPNIKEEREKYLDVLFDFIWYNLNTYANHCIRADKV